MVMLMHFIEIVCHLRKTNVLLFFGVRLVGKARHFWKTGFFLSFFCERIIIYAIDSPVVFLTHVLSFVRKD